MAEPRAAGRRWVAAIDVGGHSAKAALVCEDGTLAQVRSFPTEGLRGSPELPAAIVQIALDTAARGTAAGLDVVGVGLVVPGIVDPVARTGVSSMLLGWRDVPFGDLVHARTGLPVAVGHDVRTAARAEFGRPELGGIGDVLFVTVGTGIGAAALIGGAIRTGGHGYGGEIAHIVVEPDGPACPCGKRGCVEVIASGPAICTSYAAATGRDPATVQVPDVVAGAVAHGRVRDQAAATVWSRATAALGRAIGTYSEILDPTLIIVGGGVSAAGKSLLDPIRRQLRHSVGLPVRPDVIRAHYGNQAGIHGAALIAVEAARNAATPA